MGGGSGSFCEIKKKNVLPDIKNISILDYTYDLPAERIAAFPLAERDASKLLIYKDGKITESIYRNIADHLPEQSLLIFNNTKVIRARMLLHKKTGGAIEIFLLEPYEMISDYQSVMLRTGSVKWKCLVGGAARWKEGEVSKKVKVKKDNLREEEVELLAKVVDKLPDAFVVEFNWEPGDISFAEMLSAAGEIPLPPYIKRKTADTDSERYQTIYAKDEGSVAAPTAGLHFTEHILNTLKQKNISTGFVTLHVGAGTFKPVKAATMEDHEMHAEWIDVNTATIQQLLVSLEKNIIAVGTTSLRTLESLYWMGVKAMVDPLCDNLSLNQWEVYETLEHKNITPTASLQALLKWLQLKNAERLFAQTQLLIAPGYRFRIAGKIITNFHQPQSTLLLLVAAAIGSNWKDIYQFALDHDFRFLSYGDGCLLDIGSSGK